MYTRRLSYGFSQVGRSGQALKAPADAAALLITAFPDLTTEQRTQIIEQTATDSGYPLDLTGDGEASWERINLAAAMAAQVAVNADGSVTVTNFADATKAAIADASAITVGGVPIDGFDPEVSTYVVDVEKNAKAPAVTAVPAQPGAKVKVTEGSKILSSSGSGSGSKFTTRTIRVTSADGAVTRTYTVGLRSTDRDDRPVAAGGDHRGEPPARAAAGHRPRTGGSRCGCPVCGSGQASPSHGWRGRASFVRPFRENLRGSPGRADRVPGATVVRTGTPFNL